MDFEQSRYFSTSRVQADTGDLAVLYRNKVLRVSFETGWFIDRGHGGSKGAIKNLGQALYTSLQGMMAVHVRSHLVCPREYFDSKRLHSSNSTSTPDPLVSQLANAARKHQQLENFTTLPLNYAQFLEQRFCESQEFACL